MSNADESRKQPPGSSDEQRDIVRSGTRRRRRRAVPDTTVPSPCVAVCEYDGEGLCKGCLRNADEIREWIIMSREQKLAVLELLKERRQQQHPQQ